MNLDELLIDPTGLAGKATDATLSPRPTTLTGLTIGLLDNTKPNATALLEMIGAHLRDAHGVARTPLYTKDYFGTPLGEELLGRIAAECDAVVTAVGDCGSCSAATVADGIRLERAGVPTAAITSDAFYPSGHAMAQVEGFGGYEFTAVRHPIASLGADEIAQRADEVLPSVLQILGVES